MASDATKTPGDPSRRKLLTGLAVGGAAVVGGAVGGVGVAAASGGGWRRERMTFDVACVGDTFRYSAADNSADEADFRIPFLVEGWIYPAGTVPEAGFIPTPDGSEGRWFCRGWQVLDTNRTEPHALTHQEYVFGSITPDNLFPPDNLTSSGLEGTGGSQATTRSIVGGTGRYFGATGQVVQHPNGVNTTVFADGSGDAALNFIFEFDVLIPDV